MAIRVPEPGLARIVEKNGSWSFVLDAERTNPKLASRWKLWWKAAEANQDCLGKWSEEFAALVRERGEFVKRVESIQAQVGKASGAFDELARISKEEPPLDGPGYELRCWDPSKAEVARECASSWMNRLFKAIDADDQALQHSYFEAREKIVK